MRVLAKVLLVATGLAAVVGAGVAVQAASKDGATLSAKDQARLPAADYGADLVKLAQAVRPPAPEQGRPQRPIEDGMGPPLAHGPMAMRAGPFGGPFPMMHGPQFGRLPLNRDACEETISRRFAMAGYIKGKLQLQAAQKDAWRRIEDAAEPAVAKLREVCAHLPVKAGPPPSPPEAIDFAAKLVAARAAVLEAVRGPVRALYDTLSAEQKAALVPPGPPPI